MVCGDGGTEDQGRYSEYVPEEVGLVVRKHRYAAQSCIDTAGVVAPASGKFAEIWKVKPAVIHPSLE